MAIVDGRLSTVSRPKASSSFSAAGTSLVRLCCGPGPGGAYAFEVHPQEAVSDLADVAAVYCYARAVPATEADASGTGLEIGYIGKTGDLGRQDAEHEARGDFAGYGFDIVLVLRNEPAPARAEIRRDLIDTFDPVLNDLLRSIECGEVS
jgi:hypothetical protein